ncbi:MAG TPA: DUF6448 family protein [Usitatibacter sp.]|nr:DUF6448 family protein [Usitatibacter sp.]
MFQRKLLKSALVAAFSSVLLFGALPAAAHCDGLDGPVVNAARQALDAGDVNRVLVWVKPADEDAVRDAFRKTVEVRGLNASAKELADHAFFETVVRVHRAGEGEPYTGLKPAGRDLGPAIPAGDKAIQSGSVKPVVKLLTENVHHGIEQRYNEMMALKSYKPDDVAAGQKYVQAYVAYIHAVEKVHQATAGHGHEQKAEEAPAAHKH